MVESPTATRATGKNMPRQKKHSRRKTTQRLWRSIPEHNGQPATSPGDEFPPHAAHPPDHLSRRTFLKVMGASIALASMDGCKRKDSESIVPYVRQPAQVTPGNPLYFATAMTLGGYAQGIIATSREGRPVKLDGNPDHPATLGSSDVFMQASLLDLYDPDRLQTVKQGNSISDWDTFAGALEQTISQKSAGQFNIAILTETISSPTQVDQIQKLKQKYPKVRWYSHDPIARDNIRQGLRPATGMEILPRYDFSRAKVIVSLDCDFLQEEPGHVRYARDFIDGRRIRPGTTHMNRLYVLESTHTITGTMADHRWAMRASEILPAAIELAKSINGTKPAQDIAKDLLLAPGESLILAGAHQPPAVHQLAHAMNQSLGNIGNTVLYSAPVEADADGDLSRAHRCDDRRKRRRPDHPRRQSELFRPRRPPIRQTPSGFHRSDGPSLSHRKRNIPLLPVARCRKPISSKSGAMPALQRRRIDHPTPDRSSLRGQIRPRAIGSFE